MNHFVFVFMYVLVFVVVHMRICKVSMDKKKKTRGTLQGLQSTPQELEYPDTREEVARPVDLSS